MTADGSFWVAESLDLAVFRLEPYRRATGGAERGRGRAAAVAERPLRRPRRRALRDRLGPPRRRLAHRRVADRGARRLRRPDPRRPVFSFDPASGEPGFLDRGTRFTNGIAFGPDGLLYVNETFTSNVYRYRIEDGGRWSASASSSPTSTTPTSPGSGLRGPDGMAFSEDGRLWVTVFRQGDITVLEPDGSFDRRIKLPGNSPTNCRLRPRATRGSTSPRTTRHAVLDRRRRGGAEALRLTVTRGGNPSTRPASSRCGRRSP